MKNNTKVRLHLSKTLFENIVKEILTESKKMNMSGGAYTEAVKMPKKAKKMEEVNAVADTDKMKKMEEVDAVTDSERMRKMHEMSSKEKMAKGLYKEVDAEMDTNKMEKMDEMNSEWEKEIWKILKAKFDLDPTTATIKFGPNGMSIKPVDYQVWADKFTKGRQTGGTDNHNINAKADKIAAYFNKKYGKAIVAEEDEMEEMQINVAEESPMNEFTGTETESSGAIAMIAAALGIGIPLAAALIKDLMRAKSPEEKKQIIQKELPGQGGDVAPKEAFGPQNESKKKVMPKLNELRKQIKNK